MDRSQLPESALALPAVPAVVPVAGDLTATYRSDPPAIPPELDAQLNGRERRTVWHMLAGLSYQDALSACNVPARADIRDRQPPPYVTAAVNALLRSIAHKAGTSREWILTETVALYRRACQAEPVLDRKGAPTGTYRFDGGTAAKCLELLGKAEGVYRDRKPGELQANDVAALLMAVAERGRSREPRLVGSSSAAGAQAAPHNDVAQGRGGDKRDVSGT